MKNRKLIYFFGVILFVFLLMYVLNYFTVFTSDDFSFLYDYYDTAYRDGITRVNSLSQIISSMKNLYLYVNGRVVFHGMLQFLLMFPKVVFDVSNSLVFICLGLSIYYIIHIVLDEKVLKPLRLAFVYGLLFLLIPSFGMSVLWRSGSLNYLWSVLFIILYIIYFLKLVSKDKVNFLNIVVILFLSFISSNAPENFSITSFVFSLIVIIGNTLKNKKFKLWYIVPLIGNVFGLYLLFTAASLGSGRIDADIFNISKIFVSFKVIILSLNFMICLYLFVLVMMIFFKYKSIKVDKKIYLLYILSIFSYIPLLVSPYIADRTFFLGISLLIICLVYFFEKIFYYNLFKNIMIGIVLLFSLFVYVFIGYRDVKKSYDIYMKVEKIILDSKKKGELNVLIPNYYDEYSKYTVFNNEYAFPRGYSSFWINEWMAFYYGVDSIEMGGN